MVFAGLPGSGKSVLARGVANAIGATYLRIDTIESAIVSSPPKCDRGGADFHGQRVAVQARDLPGEGGALPFQAAQQRRHLITRSPGPKPGGPSGTVMPVVPEAAAAI